MISNWLRKRKYKVVSASPINSRDVTKGYEKRTIKREKIVIIGNKKMQYSQQLIVKRGKEFKSVNVFVNHKLKKHKDKTTELILKPKHVGDSIRL